jgi:HSP20 family protein
MSQRALQQKQETAPEKNRPALPLPPHGPTRGPTVHYGFIWWPPVDLEETDEAYVFSSDLTGVDRNDLTIELTGTELAISGEVKREERSDVVRGQVSTGAHFAYSITLPEPVEADAIDASLENGVLKIVVPKPKPSQRQRIALK